jgi:hypothetical protein
MYKFKIGERLFPARSVDLNVSHGAYVVLKRLPMRGGEFEYQIRRSLSQTSALCARVNCDQFQGETGLADRPRTSAQLSNFGRPIANEGAAAAFLFAQKQQKDPNREERRSGSLPRRSSGAAARLSGGVDGACKAYDI